MANSEPSLGVLNGKLELLSENISVFPFQQAVLNYELNSLAPNIGGDTMDFHYNKHHKAYTDNFNGFYEKEAIGASLINVMANVSRYSDGFKNNLGGYFNHNMFWNLLTPNSTKAPIGELAQAITANFGTFEAFKEQFNAAAMGRFGSGWAWLCLNSEGKLFISSTPNQNNPLMDVVAQKGVPVFTIDVWEHAYYLNYQNRRADYVKNFWEVINWEEAERRYQEAKLIFA
jgi:Fe-Mn family superoxide dismutase